jgi:thiamine kinase-like enzyme
MTNTDMISRIKALPLWQGEITLEPLTGGITNVNFLVEDNTGKYVVRFGDDIPEHHVMRFNELAANRAAYEVGLSPKVIHAEKSLTVLQYIQSTTLKEEDVRKPEMLPRIITLVKKYHTEVPKHFRGPAMIFWVFHVVRDYSATLLDNNSVHKSLIPELLSMNEKLEQASGPFDMVFGHNDLLCGNILDDGKRLWLIDFDYAGFNSPLFDLGGLASNNGLSEGQEKWMLETYFETPTNQAMLHRYEAMKCASLLRETMWSMVSEIKSEIDFDYAAYTAENYSRFKSAYDNFLQS